MRRHETPTSSAAAGATIACGRKGTATAGPEDRRPGDTPDGDPSVTPASSRGETREARHAFATASTSRTTAAV